jgi:hypothetical protein
MITTRRVVLSVILAAAFAVMVYGFTQVRPTNTPVVFKNSKVVTVYPAVNSTGVFRQSKVAVTLAPGYTLAYQNSEGMSIGVSGAGVGIPQDELDIFPGQNEFTFSPGAGKTLTELPAGRVCVGLLIVPTSNLADPGTSFSWCFPTQ